MSSSPLTILPQHGGANLADIKPLLRLGEGDKSAASSLAEAIRERFTHFLKTDEPTWKEMFSAGEETAHFMAGRQFLTPNPFRAGGWLPYQVKNGGNELERRALSLMQHHTSGNLEKWLNSNPDVRVTPGINSDDAYEASEGANIVVSHYEPKFYTARNSIAECLEGLTFGSYIWRLRVDPTLKSVTAYRQIFENREVKIGVGWGKCGDCGNEGSAEDFNEVEGVYTCPKCHGEALVIPPASDTVPSETGREPVELGDFRLDLQSFAQCRWDLKYHADESPWMIIRKKTSTSALRQILGNIKLPEGGSDDYGLDVVDRLAYAGQARAGRSDSNAAKRTLYKDPATVEEFWMSPDEYGDIILKQDVETVGGQGIKKDIPLGLQFKGQSICVLGINEMSTVLGIFLEDHRDYIVQGKWYSKTGTGAGRGLQDLTEVQKVFNSDHQQTHTYLRSIATPAMLVASDVLGEEGKARYLGTPNTNIPIQMAMLAEGVKLNELASPAFQMPPVQSQFFEFTYNRLAEFAQFASHFMPFTGGLPGVDNKTATGANITQAATNALYTPVLSVKGEIRRLIAEKLIKAYPRHFPVEREFPLGGKYQSHTGKFLKVNGVSLDTQLLFEVVADSWNPRNSYIKRQDYMGFMQMVGGPQGYMAFKQAEPDRLADLERTFDLELPSETRNVSESLCFRRVRMMQAAANLIQDPAMLLTAIQPGIVTQNPEPPIEGQPYEAFVPTVDFIIEPAHEVKINWLREYLDSDTGQDAPPQLRAAVAALVKLHFQAKGMVDAAMSQQQGQAQVAGQAPQMQAQQEMQQAQGQQQLGQQQAELGLKAQEAIGGQLLSQAELENKAQEQDLEHSHLQRVNDEKQVDREHQVATQAMQQAIKGNQ